MNKEVTGTSALQGTITLPPDKSISHRSAMFAALAEGESVIENYSQAADPQSTLSCLRQLGIEIQADGSGTVVVQGAGIGGFREPSEVLDCGNSGTTMRLMSGMVAGAGINVTLDGDASLRSRTMKRVIDPLQEMGALISGRDDNYAPLQISSGGRIRGFRYPLPIASAQLKSAVLLAGLYGEEPTEVVETIPSRDHTERLLQLPSESFGTGIVIRSSRSHLVPQQNYRVPGDFSAAAFWLVAGAIHPNSEIVLHDVGLNPSRTAALLILQEMGADIEIEKSDTAGPEPMGRVTVRSSGLRAISLDPALIPNCIDELPIIMIAMSFAEGRSEIAGAGELRHKETDRLRAMSNLLETAGERFEVSESGILIHGRGNHRPEPGIFESEHDHRIAMSAAVMGLMADGTSSVLNAECTSISYPGFWSDLELLSQ
ncbi:MAG: 3-phosphoshikimate 1-carboxyvinyltransferase [Balneolaceae bacterium]